MDREQVAKDLYDARLLRNRKEVEQFEEARTALTETGDPAVLPSLLVAFDDATEQEDVMWGLVHDAESLGLQEYLREVGAATPVLLPRAKNWLVLLHERILNSKKVSAMYPDVVQRLSRREQEAVAEVVREIEGSNEKLKKPARDVLKAIGG